MKANKMRMILALVSILMAIPAWAGSSTVEGTFDLMKLTCKELMRGNDSDREIGIAFYHGFLAGQKNEQTMDLHAASALTDAVKEYCLSNPTETVMSAFTKSKK